MYIRLKHANIFHHKGFRLMRIAFMYSFDKFIILVNRMIMLLIGITESLAGRAANNNIYFSASLEFHCTTFLISE